MIEFHAGEQQERMELRQVVRAIARDFGHSYYVECAEAGEFPQALWEELAAAGMPGINVAEVWGGGDGSLVDLAILAEELAAQGCPLLTLVVSNGVCVPILQAHGSIQQCERWLPSIATGQSRMAFAITEGDAGTNTHAIRTRAIPSGNGWKLVGEKQYISALDDSEHVMVVCRTSDDRSQALSVFVVPTDRAGISFSPIKTHVIAAERQSILTFDEVCVDETELIGDAGAGFSILFDGLNPERIMSAATCLGLARYALDKAVAYANTRSVWGAPIGSHQAVSHPLASCYAEIQGGLQVLYGAAAASGPHDLNGTRASVAKLLAARTVDHALDAAIQVHGGNGLSAEYGLADLWGVARLYRIAPVSDEMTLNHLASHALGLPRSY